MSNDQPAGDADPAVTSADTHPSKARASIPARAVLFDCDGVLVNSDDSVISAWSRWATRYCLMPAEVVKLVHGRRASDTVAAPIDTDQRSAALKTINQFEIEDAASVRAIAGARDLLSSLPEGSWAVVTSGLLKLAKARIMAAHLPLPGVLVTADLVSKGKPDPEGYLLAAEMLGVATADCVVVEDAVDGVRAARAANVGAVIGVGSRLEHQPIDALVTDLTELAWTPSGLVLARTS